MTEQPAGHLPDEKNPKECVAGQTDQGPMLPITAVERETGLGKDTLRAWERRYGFPVPHRGERLERLYPLEQVDKLRLVRRLLDQGRRPAALVNLSVEALNVLLSELEVKHCASLPVEEHNSLRERLRLIQTRDLEGFSNGLQEQLDEMGLSDFILRVMAPMVGMVGDLWVKGEYEIFEEHLFTELIQTLLRRALVEYSGSFGKPKILLSSLPGEPHGLGLLMAECMFEMAGAQAISLGPQTPTVVLVRACERHEADVLALSFSALQTGTTVRKSITELRALLPDSIELWCGGSSPVLRRRGAQGFKLLSNLTDIAPAVSAWQSAHR